MKPAEQGATADMIVRGLPMLERVFPKTRVLVGSRRFNQASALEGGEVVVIGCHRMADVIQPGAPIGMIVFGFQIELTSQFAAAGVGDVHRALRRCRPLT
jgi:hypothetical protein